MFLAGELLVPPAQPNPADWLLNHPNIDILEQQLLTPLIQQGEEAEQAQQAEQAKRRLLRVGLVTLGERCRAGGDCMSVQRATCLALARCAECVAQSCFSCSAPGCNKLCHLTERLPCLLPRPLLTQPPASPSTRSTSCAKWPST